MSILVLDPSSSGVAGDLLIASILNTQDEKFCNDFCRILKDKLKIYDPDFDIEHLIIQKKGFFGSQLITKSAIKFPPNKLMQIVNDTGIQLKLSKKSQKIALNSIELLIEAEKKVHGYQSSDKFHFHELATIDTVFDIIGFSYLLDSLELHKKRLYILPIALGGGRTSISHGNVPVPTPVTLEIIRIGNLIIKGGPINEELFTPTGAALLASLKATPVDFLPIMQIDTIGRSFGTRSYENEFLGCFQIISGTQPLIFSHEEITILETNIDDVEGETLGYLFELLFEKKLVLDLSIINTISKKNRPGFLVRAIVQPSKVHQVTQIISQELGTLGIRILPCFRHIIQREKKTHQIDVLGTKETVRTKKGVFDSGIISEKIEFEDIRRIAREKNQPLHKIRKIIQTEINKKERNDLDDEEE